MAQPYALSISLNQDTEITGQITLNGKLSQKLEDSQSLITSSKILSKSVISQNSSQSSSSSVSTNEQGETSASQTSVISIESDNLAQSDNPSITANQATEITGQITLNGKLIQDLKVNQALINLSPLLSKARQTIKISGTYQPVQLPVKVEFSRPDTQVTQQTSGNGILDQTLIINVQ